jgi:hypothetical protein
VKFKDLFEKIEAISNNLVDLYKGYQDTTDEDKKIYISQMDAIEKEYNYVKKRKDSAISTVNSVC